MESEKFAIAVEMLRTAAHPIRLQILKLLVVGTSKNNTELQEALGIGQAILSQHLTLMKDKGLLRVERKGKFRYYQIQHPDFIRIIECLEHCSKHL